MLCSFSLQFIYFFSEQRFHGNYLTLDAHTNTVISHAFAYPLLVKMASKTVTRSYKVYTWGGGGGGGGGTAIYGLYRYVPL